MMMMMIVLLLLLLQSRDEVKFNGVYRHRIAWLYRKTFGVDLSAYACARTLAHSRLILCLSIVIDVTILSHHFRNDAMMHFNSIAVSLHAQRAASI